MLMKKSNTIGVFETKTNLNKIISRVIEGEEFIVTKRGVEVAKISPLRSCNSIEKVFQDISILKTKLSSNFASIEEIIQFKDENRK